MGKGSPFLDLDQLRPGDPIVVETRDSWFVYRVLRRLTGDPPSGIPGQEIVRPTDVDVIAPVPNSPGAEPTASYLTLTTCHPRFSARQRLIVHAVLDGGPVAKADAARRPARAARGLRGHRCTAGSGASSPAAPAPRPLLAVVLVLAVAALLLFVVFPWVEPHLPFNQVTVD